jgi:hypothetical protein
MSTEPGADRRDEHELEWACPTCRASCRTAYCSACGERRPSASDLRLRDLAAQALESFVNFDGRLFRSLSALILHPGELTKAYLAGKRKPFVGPIQLFLAANVLVFAAQSVTGLGLFSTPLSNHMHGEHYSRFATELVERRLAARGISLEAYAPAFDRAALTNSKTLVVLMVPLFALATALLFRTRARSWVPPLVFSLHLFAFQMVAFSGLFVLAALAWLGLRAARAPIEWHAFDVLFSWIEVSTIAAYLWLATRTVYPGSPIPRTVRVVLLAGTTPFILYAYRLAVFLITLYTT